MEAKISCLSNGLKVISAENPNSRTIYAGVWVKTGSRNEEEDQAGISHLIEHMVFKGTKTRNNTEINQQIENIGGDINAMTSEECTIFAVDVMKGDLEIGIDILSDMMLNPLFHEKELKREKSVVAQEIRNYKDDKESQISCLFNQTAYSNKFFEWDITGYIKTVRAMSPDELRHYMQKYYIANNMVVVASGNFKHEDLVALSEKYFGALPSGSIPLQVPFIYNAGFSNYKKGTDSLEMTLGFNADNHCRLAPANILANVLGGGMSSRLFHEAREKRGLTYDISTELSCGYDSGLFLISASSSPANFNKIIDVTTKQIQRICHESISDEEMKRAKKILSSLIERRFEQNSCIAHNYAKQMLISGNIVLPEEMITEIYAVTKEEVMNAARDIFSTPLTYSVYGKCPKMYSYSEVEEKIRF